MRKAPKPLCGEEIEAAIRLECVDGSWKSQKEAFVVGEEVPVDLIFNEMSTYATMMLTPFQLEDFALGFCLSERIIKDPSQLLKVEAKFEHNAEGRSTYKLYINIQAEAFANLLKRSKRNIAGATACGICGGDGDELSKGLPRLVVGDKDIGEFTLSAISNACQQLRPKQTLNKELHMLHAAAWADFDGDITFVREDLGRHNALDKLIGVLKRMDKNIGNGFCLITSRCSFEMAQKSVLAGIKCLVAASSPTSYAVEIAKDAGMTLIGKATEDRLVIFSHQERIDLNK